jgi:hypothetical protein
MILMNWIDFIIGALLMNAMPHFILGIWKGKMLSGFGVGNSRNIVWGIVNFVASVSLFIYQYTLHGFKEHVMYTGAVFIMVTFFCTSYFWYRYFNK